MVKCLRIKLPKQAKMRCLSNFRQIRSKMWKRQWRICNSRWPFHHCGSSSAGQINILTRQNHGFWRRMTAKGIVWNVMAHLAESLRQIAILLKPFLTETPEEIFVQLGVSDASMQNWDSLYQSGQIEQGTKVRKNAPIFPRLDVEKEVQIIKDMMHQNVPEEKPAAKIPEQADEIVYDDFMKVDMRVAEILKAEKVKK